MKATIPLSAQVWGFRIVALVLLILLCALAGSGVPTLAFAWAWGPNGLFLYLAMRGSLHLPQFLVPVREIEPALYRWLGVGFVKRIVATDMWPRFNGFPPPPKLANRQELLQRTEVATTVAEVCHGATFILASFVMLYYMIAERFSDALWVLAFNVVLNAYPVMLQRSNRWRVQHVRASKPFTRIARADAPSTSA